MIAPDTALQIAQRWFEDWNRHDLEAMLSHYAEDIDFTSPFIVKVLGNPEGRVQGKAALREYFTKGLAAYPDLKFEPLVTLIGVNSIVLHYRSVNQLLSAEFMEINAAGLVHRVVAHYDRL